MTTKVQDEAERLAPTVPKKITTKADIQSALQRIKRNREEKINIVG